MTVRRDRTPWIIVAILSGVIACMVIGILGAWASWWWNQNQTKVRVTGAPSVVAPIPSPTVIATSLLPVPPLATGFERWQMWLQDGSRVRGNNLVQMVSDSKYKQVVQFSRANGQGDGGAAGLILPLDLNVAAYPHLYVQLIGKIENEKGGNLGGVNLNVYPEGAVQVRLKYLTAKGQEREWYHGWYTSAILRADEAHFTQVLESQWFTYVSPDLKSLADTPQIIKEIRVYGFGWEFSSKVAQIDLVGATP